MTFDDEIEANTLPAAKADFPRFSPVSGKELGKDLRGERKHLVKQLREDRERFHTLYNSMAEMVVFHEIVMDQQGRAVDYRILDCNPAFTAVTGVARKDAVGRLASELYQTGNPPFLDLYTRVVETGEALSFETEFEPMGRWFSISVVATQKGCFATVTTDITQHKKTQIALEESEAKYRAVVENCLAGVYVVQDGLIRYANKRWCEIYGYSYEEVVDRLDPLDLTPPEHKELVSSNFRKRLSGETDQIEYEVNAIRKDGRIIAVRILGSTILYRGRIAVSGTIIDVTEQRKVEDDLKRKTALLEAEVNTSPVGILIVDKGKKVLQNQRVVEFLGIPPHVAQSDDDEIQVQWVKSVTKDPEMFYSKVQHMFAHPNEKLHDELELANGTILERYSGPVIGADGTDYGRLWMFLDITERKQAEKALATSERRLSAAIEVAEIFYWEEDPCSSTFTFNDPLYTFLGTSAEREGGYRMNREDYINRFVHPDDRWLLSQATRRIVRSEKRASYDEEHRVVRRDGEIRHVLIRTKFVRDEKGQTTAIYGSMQNISERKENQEVLRLTQTQLIDAMNLARIVYWDSDVSTSELILNDSFYEFYGTTADREGGYRMTMEEYSNRFVHPDDRQLVYRFTRKNSLCCDIVFADGLEHRIIGRDGRVRHIRALTRIVRNESGQIVSRRGANQDITQQKQAELELEAEKVRLANIIEGTHAGTWEWNVQTGETVFNDVWADLVGYTIEELAPVNLSTWEKLTHPDDLKHAQEVLKTHFAGKTDYYSVEIRMKHKDGHWIWMLDRGRLISRTSDGRPLMMFGTHIDITAIKNAEESLKVAKAQLSQAVELAGIVYWVYDRENDCYILNDAVYGLYGTTAEQQGGYTLPRKRLMEFLVHPDDRPAVPLNCISRVLQDNSTELLAHYEHRILLFDGGIRFVHAVVRQVKDVSGSLISRYGAMQDITARKQSEDEIRMLKHSIDVYPDGAYWLNTDHRFTYVNDSACRDLGYTREELLGNTVFLVNSAASERRMAAVWEKLRTEGFFRAESVHRRKDGSEFPVEIVTTYVQFDGNEYACGFARDITDRRRIQDALIQSEERLTKVFRASPVSVSISSIESGKILDVNERFLEKTGFAKNEVIGRTTEQLDLFVKAEDRLELLRKLSANSGIRDYEVQLKTRNGEIKDVLLSSEIIDINGDKCSIVFIYDQTERKNLEAQLRQSQKMEAIGTLAGGIAHDFNNILTVITGFVHLLRDAVAKKMPVKSDYVDQIAAAAEKASRLTRSLLAVSRKQDISLDVQNLNKLVGETGQLLKRLLTEDIELYFSLSDSKPFIMADATQIDQILFNLVANARDAMSNSGGSIKIETDTVELDIHSMDMYGCDKPGKYALLSVSDNGVGMDRATTERIFEPFFTTKEVGKGTGLGLSTVYGIVAQHEGYISVFSEPNHGTTFRILFPVVYPETNAKAGSAPQLTQTGNETILVVDDDPGVRALISEVLKTSGYRTLQAGDGEEALRIFRSKANAIDLVILDVVMPRMNGKDASDKIKEINPATKILFISGYTRDIVLEKGSRDGSIDFMRKPLLPDMILTKVREVLERTA
ncbi:MAG TPA: PAS domain S-box protein [Syntrophorhabdaceae bacterium]|nr:PAS domain S-box protein [Syntrophorhabdaceae bacterium]